MWPFAAGMTRAEGAAVTSALARLTTGERAVLDHVAQRRDNQTIGQLMHLSPGTVRNYVSPRGSAAPPQGRVT